MTQPRRRRPFKAGGTRPVQVAVGRTWKPQTWKLPEGKLTASELSLVTGALDRIRIVLEQCECGAPVEKIGKRDRCAECWGKRQ